MNASKLRTLLVLAAGQAIVVGMLLWLAPMEKATSVEASPGIIYVDQDAPGPAHNGLTWTTAYTTVQVALTGAISGTEIWVAEGTYYPGAYVTSTFLLTNGVALYGGFAATETLRTQRDWGIHVTTLSGDIDGNDLTDHHGVVTTTAHISGTNAWHVTIGSGTDSTAILDGFTITAGNADECCLEDHNGGGMYNANGGPMLTHVIFSGNRANWDSGGMHNNASNPILTDVMFHSNRAGSGGGGMCNTSGSNPQLINVIFSNNEATVGSGGSGGGMCNYGSNPTLTNVTFSGNQATYGCGGMDNYYSSPMLTNVTFNGNKANTGGGGMCNSYSSPRLTNITFSGNRASYGGGIANESSNPTLVNGIVWGNSPDQIHNDSNTPSVTYSDVQGGYPGTGNIDADPQFIAPITATAAPTATGNYRLLADSPAIDAGNTLSVTAPTDLDGNPRVMGGAVDMGAYEFQATGIYLIPSSQSGQGGRGQIMTYEARLSSFIETTDSFTLTLGSHTWDSSLSMDSLEPIESGESLTFSVYITIPLNVPWYSMDAVVVTATSVTSPTVYSDTATFTTQAYAPSQISVSPDGLTSTQYVNEIVTKPLTVSNGNGVTLTFTLAAMSSNGLVAYYPFNGNTDDESGNGNDGTVEGATLTADRLGNPDSAYSFDGVDDFVEIPNSASLNISGPLTIDAWIHPDTVAGNHRIVGKGGWAPHEDFILVLVGNTLRFGLASPGGGSTEIDSVQAISAGVWTHVAGVFDGSTMRMYINGILDPVTGSHGTILTGSSRAWIGASPDRSGFESFDGINDEIHIYNRALSEAEIREFWQGNDETPWLSKSPISGTVPAYTSTPVQVTFDATGMQPGEYTTEIAIQSNDPIRPSVSVPVTMTVSPTADMGWVAGAVTDAWTGLPLTATVELVGVYSMTARPDYTIWATAGAYSLTAYASGHLTQTTAVAIVARQGITHNFALELNVPRLSLSPSTLEVTHYAGDVTTRVLTITNAGPAPLTFDLASASVPGAVTLRFDGMDDQLNMGDVLMLTDSDFTLEAWISTTQTAHRFVVGKHDPGWWDGYAIGINVDYAPDKVWFYTAQGAQGEAVSTSNVNDGHWHHIAAVYYASGIKQLFVDGVLEDSKSAPVPIPSNTAPFRVGYASESWPEPDYFQGQVDEVRVWSIARTQAQIQNAMNTRLVGNEPGLVGYWRLEEGSGQIAYDSTVNGYDGQLGSTPGVDDSDPSWRFASSGALPLWLTAAPLTGTVPAYSSTPIQVTFDAAGMQPSEYTTDIVVQSNDLVKPSVSIPTTMTVLPTASMGWVEGAVTDATTGDPLTATIIALGQPYTITTGSDGSYQLWLEAGSYTLQAAATGYATQTAGVSITAQQGITRNFALELNVPRLEISPNNLHVTHYVSDVTTRILTITDNGPVELTYNIATGAPSNGLVAYYPFNGNANDESGNGNDGTIEGATLTADRFGNPNSAYSFDGADDYIRVSDDNSLDLLDGLTILAWIKSDDTSGGRNIVSKWNDNTDDHSYIFKDWDYNDKLGILLRGNDGAYFAGLQSTTSITTGEWLLVATTFDSSTARLYLNGAQDASSTAPGIIRASATDMLIGAVFTWGGIYQNFDGIIDDVRIYNRALTDEEILELYHWQGGSNAPWLSVNPISGTVPAHSSTPVQVIFNAVGTQPGEYTTEIIVQSNDPVTPSVSVPVTMTVNATANMGRVTGSVSDAWTGKPLTTTIELVGVYSMTASPDYTIWATAGAYSLTAYAPDYFTTTRSAAIVAGGLVTVNLALEPAQSRLEWTPLTVSAGVDAGGKVSRTLLISNTGPAPLEIALHEISPTLTLYGNSSGRLTEFAIHRSQEDFIDGHIHNDDNRLLANNILAWLTRPGYGDVPWLSETPLTTTIPGHSSLPVAIGFDATALAPGIYRATLAIEHNDPARSSPAEISVTLTVAAQQAALSLTPALQEGSGDPGMVVVYTFTVTNESNTTDSFNLSASGTWTPTLSVTNTGQLGAGQSLVFTLDVAIPFSLTQVASDTTTIVARSALDPGISRQAQAITTALPPSPWRKIFLPVVVKNSD